MEGVIDEPVEVDADASVEGEVELI